VAERMTLLPLLEAVALLEDTGHTTWECELCDAIGGGRTALEAEQRAVEHLRLDHRGVTSR
jgi:hypothetical protein